MIKFNFGNKKPTIIKYAIVGILLTSVITLFSQCSHIPENNLWDLVDQIQRKYFPQSIINDFIIKDKDKLERRINRDIDKAISDYERNTGGNPEYELPSPIYSEKPIDELSCYTKECKSLGGEMRLCSPWVEGCNKTDS